MSIPFPWKPYPQQSELMEAMLTCIQQRKIGILESPTGTGKSLSTICSCLYWLMKEEKDRIEQYEKDFTSSLSSSSSSSSSSSTSNDDWLTEMLKPKETVIKKEKSISKEALDRFKMMKKALRDVPDTSLRIPIKSSYKDRITSNPHKTGDDHHNISTEDREFILDPYDSDSDHHTSYNDDDSDDDHENDDDHLHLPQIIYCSRTHSQLSQFVGEIQRCSALFPDVRCITLGSRKNLCINDELKTQYTSDARLSEACIDLQKSKTSSSSSSSSSKKRDVESMKTSSSSCMYHQHHHESQYVSYALGRVRDIEELVSLGKKTHACPYYATRRAIKHAQIICMPYNMILHDDLRRSMGINIHDAVVIFDEAHNVIDTINQLYSAEVSYDHIDAAMMAVSSYYDRFTSSLHGKNMYYISLLRTAIQRLHHFIASEHHISSSSSSSGVDVMTANNFLFDAGMDNINLVKLCQYITITNLIPRIGGYNDHQRNKLQRRQDASLIQPRSSPSSSSMKQLSSSSSSSSYVSYTNALRQVISLLRCLMSTDADGRIFIYHHHNQPSSSSSSSMSGMMIRYVLFNPSHHFQPIVNQARSIIMLGGTMKPFPYIISSLFPSLSSSSFISSLSSSSSSSSSSSTTSTSSCDRIITFSCDHVIPAHQVAPYIVSYGPTGYEFEFNYQHRYHHKIMDELYLFLLHIIIPSIRQGIIIFFSSYKYMDHVISYMKTSSAYETLYHHKPIFIEPSSAEEGERLLARYSAQASSSSSSSSSISSSGAMLFCVMGGKLSEGINFSDDLARCVIVTGLPYPDQHDPILSERMKYLNHHNRTSSSSSSSYPSSAASAAGRALYEGICMRQVNQSIGRAIRHRHDYASIILLDKRYQQHHISCQLPSWIEKSLMVMRSADELRQHLLSFIQRNQQHTGSK